MSIAGLCSFLATVALLAVLAVASRKLPGSGRAPATLGWTDLALLLGSGLVTAVLGAWLMAPIALEDGVVTGADFQEYCASVASLRGDGLSHWYAMRSKAPGLVPALMARPLGLVDGLVSSALLGSAVLGMALFAWGRAIHGRLAGLAAVVLALAFPPLVLAGRVLSFYPQIAAWFVVAAATAAAAMRWRTRLALVLGGCGVGLALLADGIGLVWALPCGLVVLVAALRAPRRSWPARLAVVLLPVVLSWFVGRWANAETHPLELQLGIMVRTHQTDGAEPVQLQDTGYRWGWSNPIGVPGTLLRIWSSSGDAGRQLQDREPVLEARERRVAPWLPLLWAALVPTVLALRRRPWLLFALLLGCLPFVGMLHRAATMETNLRFLLLALPFAPVLLALALACALEGARPEPRQASAEQPSPVWARALRPAIALSLSCFLLAGPGWTPLSFRSSGRPPFRAVNDAGTAVDFAITGQRRPNPVLEPCIQGLQADHTRGVPTESRFYGNLTDR